MERYAKHAIKQLPSHAERSRRKQAQAVSIPARRRKRRAISLPRVSLLEQADLETGKLLAPV